MLIVLQNTTTNSMDPKYSSALCLWTYQTPNRPSYFHWNVEYSVPVLRKLTWDNNSNKPKTYEIWFQARNQLTKRLHLYCSCFLTVSVVNRRKCCWPISACHDVIKSKHFPRHWPFMRGIHRSPVNSPHKGQWRGALICLNKRLSNIVRLVIWDAIASIMTSL